MKNRSSLTLFGGDFGWGGGNAFCCCQSHGSAYPDDHLHGDHCDDDDQCDDDHEEEDDDHQTMVLLPILWVRKS